MISFYFSLYYNENRKYVEFSTNNNNFYFTAKKKFDFENVLDLEIYEKIF